MLSQSGRYALSAVTYLAAVPGGPSVTATQLAAELDLPRNYLSKILWSLVHAGVLAAARGPHGGYHLAVPADELTLADVLAPFEAGAFAHCMLGRHNCAEGVRCGTCRRWLAVASEVDEFFATTRVADLAASGPARAS